MAWILILTTARYRGRLEKQPGQFQKFEAFDQPIEIVNINFSFFVLLVPKQLFIDAGLSKYI